VTNINLQPKSNSTRVSMGLYFYSAQKKNYTLIVSMEKHEDAIFDRLKIKSYYYPGFDVSNTNLCQTRFRQSSLSSEEYLSKYIIRHTLAKEHLLEGICLIVFKHPRQFDSNSTFIIWIKAEARMVMGFGGCHCFT
jgi:hypothetical protein